MPEKQSPERHLNTLLKPGRTAQPGNQLQTHAQIAGEALLISVIC